MGKKKPGKAAKGGAASAIPPKQTAEEVVASVLAAVFPDEDGDAREVAAEMIIEQKEALVTAKAKGELSDGVLEVISGANIEPTDEQLAALTKGLACYQLGLGNPTAYFETTAGSFTAEIYLEAMPLTASNFIALADEGFYDGLHFHRIVANFMAQFGCPVSKDPKAEAGEGAPPPGSTFTVVGSSPDAGATITRLSDGESAGCITDEHTAKLSNIPGALAMANNDAPNTGGSQFFVNVADNEALNWWTDGDSKHPVFGQVSPDGLTVIQSICKVETDGDEKPVKAIKVKTIAIR